MLNIKKLEQENNKIKFRYRLKLGLSQFVNIPLLNLIWLPIIAILSALWKAKETVMAVTNLPQIIHIPLTYSIVILEILLTILMLMGVLTAIAEIIAHNDEKNIRIAFYKKGIEIGCPILIKKQKVGNNGAIQRVFYSNIPLKTWEAQEDTIADVMNISFLEPIKHYNGNGKKIEMLTSKGRDLPDRGVMYDEP